MARPRGEYRKSAERRLQILDAATAVFARSGYSAASVNEIARAVGVTQTAVLHHFAGGKIALLRAVLEQRDMRAEGTLADRHGRDFLAGLIEISRGQENQPGAVQLYSTLSAEAVDPDHPAHEYFMLRLNRIVDAVARAFAEIESEDGLRTGVEPRNAALLTVAMVEGLELLWLRGLVDDMATGVRGYMNSLLSVPL
jgi:AcrR family transcriptional regulator